MANGDGAAEAEIPLKIEGEERWIACRLSEKSGDQETSRILALQDITDIKRLEQHREATRNLLALAELSSVLSHEIRNPLGSLELLSGLLEGCEGLSSEEKQWVVCMKAELRSLGCSVSNLLRLHNNGCCRKKEFKLGDLISTAFELLLPLARKAEVLLTTTIGIELDQLTVLGDRQALLEVLLNLGTNALQNTPAGGQVRITASRENKQGSSALALQVLDSGNGIPEANLPRVFEVGFSTLGRSGLGLAICQKIIVEHGGEIMIRSRAGAGTTARIELPQA
jgi:two-component system sensor histidine kinase FlrB